MQWVIEAYALMLGGLILVGGSMGDQFGRKRVFLGGVVFFTAASIFCGAAPSPRALIVGRALQGFGAAFLVPGSLAILGATFDGCGAGQGDRDVVRLQCDHCRDWSGRGRVADPARELASGVLPERPFSRCRDCPLIAVHGRKPR